MITLYGISNCDTMKKARSWLHEHAVEYAFHDYKKRGIDESTLRAWIKDVGWEVLLNRRGMMWRNAPDDVKASIDETSAMQLMLKTPSIIKRPVLDIDGKREVGFDPARYQALLT